MKEILVGEAGPYKAEPAFPFISDEQLASNAQHMPEMSLPFTEGQLSLLPAIAGQLLRVPLIHGTSQVEDRSVMLRMGISPSTERSGLSKGNTKQIDSSLGLDTCTFASWGSPYVLGTHLLYIDARVLLDTAVVTDEDVTEYVGAAIDTPFQDQPPEVQQMIHEKYFGRMLHGKDWIEVVSRRVLKHLIENEGEPYVIPPYCGLGEVKCLGVLHPSYIMGIGEFSEDVPTFAAELLGLGFVDSDIYEWLNAGNNFWGYPARDDIMTSINAWQTSLGIDDLSKLRYL